jgi:fatty acid desaturase
VLAPDDPERKRKIKRPVVSDLDGTREGGLAFCIVLIMGMVLGAALAPGALTSFWVWVGLLAMAIAIAVNLQRAVARLTGFKPDNDEEED